MTESEATKKIFKLIYSTLESLRAVSQWDAAVRDNLDELKQAINALEGDKPDPSGCRCIGVCNCGAED